MKINLFEFTNHDKDLKIKRTDFHDLSLLVGASGVGKTQILRAILDLKKIANGKAVNGAEWNIEFKTNDGEYFIWRGEYDINKALSENTEYKLGITSQSDFDDDQLPSLLWEKLEKNGKTILQRDEKEIVFKGNQTVKLSQKQSAVSLLKEEDELQGVEEAFKNVKFSDYTTYTRDMNFWFNDYTEPEKYKTLSKIKSINRSVITKLYFAFYNELEVFEEIQERFVEIFPTVESIEYVEFETKKLFMGGKTPVLSIKEKGINDLIDITRISSGMRRTLLHIADVYLSSDGSVFLIDEFENSLGVNCIDELTEYILSPENEAQFIVTSHHPYIINNIEPIHWKVVARNAGNILTFNASDLNIGKSSHEAFIQLINSETYRTGTIEV